MPQKRKKNTDQGSIFRPVHCCIGVDQSYSRTGISLAVDGKLKVVRSVDLHAIPSKTLKRRAVSEALGRAISSALSHYPPTSIAVICERLRLFSSGAGAAPGLYTSPTIRPGVIKPASAMIAYLVDRAYDYDICVWSADTRAWKTAVLGTSRPLVEPLKGVKDPQKIRSVKFIIQQGFEKEISLCRNHGAFYKYDDDAADSACIALYGFTKKPLLQREY